MSYSSGGVSPKPEVIRERAKSFVFVDDDGESEMTMKRRGSMGPPRTPFSPSGLHLILDLPDGPKMWTPPEDVRGI